MVQVERARMVRNGKLHIGCVIALNNVTLRARVLDSDIVRCGGDNTGSFDGSPGLTMISLPGLSDCTRAASSASMAVCVTSSGTHCAATRALIKLSPRSRQKKQPLSSAGATAVEW